MEWKWNGDGMEIKMTNQVEAKFNEMEWKGNGNGMENVGEKKFCKMDLEMKRIGNGMEMEIIIRLVQNWGGAVQIVRWNFRQKNGKGIERNSN